jgi:hypothetical protein
MHGMLIISYLGLVIHVDPSRSYMQWKRPIWYYFKTIQEIVKANIRIKSFTLTLKQGKLCIKLYQWTTRTSRYVLLLEIDHVSLEEEQTSNVS